MKKPLNKSTKFMFACDNDRCTMEASYIATSKENAIGQFEKSMKELDSIEKLKDMGLVNDTGAFNYGAVITITEEYAKAS
ncbi:hypothetical protein bcgnr5390_10790 [Bacillus luti]|nr:hypothetical protein BC2903_30110 [Bacillus cereus]